VTSVEAFEPVPRRTDRFARPRVDQPDLVQSVMHPRTVTGLANHDRILKVISAASGVR
jgi:hypothetical protein